MERRILNRAASLERFTPAWARTLYRSMTRSEQIAAGALIVLLVISGIASVAGYINRNTELIPQAGGVYREAAIGQPRFINPILAGANDIDLDLSRLIYTGLFRFNNSLELTNDLATGVEISDDQQQYTITLRQDVTWHDGEQFTADDVVFTIRSIQTPDYASPLATAFQGVTVEKVDDFTVVFKLSQPYVPFLTSLTVGIVPEHVWALVEPQNASLAEQVLKPIGTGPFKFAEITTRRKTGDITSFRTERFDEYYGQPPYLDEIVMDFHTTQDEALQALSAGEAQGIGFLTLQDRDQAASIRKTDIHRLLIPQYFAVFFNQQNNEILGEAGVRQALALVTDREAIVKQALKDEGEVLHLPIPPGTLVSNGEPELPEINVEAAKQNLEESGWQEGSDGIREKDGQRLTINLITTDWPEYITTAQLLQQQWREIGVELNLEHLSAGTIQQTIVQPRDYEALLFGEILPADPDPYPFWHSTQARSPGLNLALFQNQEVDKMLEEARKEPDTAKREELYREFENKIIELNPAIILYRPYYLFATTSVHGIRESRAAIPAGRFNDIENWHINTERIWKN